MASWTSTTGLAGITKAWWEEGVRQSSHGTGHAGPCVTDSVGTPSSTNSCTSRWWTDERRHPADAEARRHLGLDASRTHPYAEGRRGGRQASAEDQAGGEVHQELRRDVEPPGPGGDAHRRADEAQARRHPRR